VKNKVRRRSARPSSTFFMVKASRAKAIARSRGGPKYSGKSGSWFSYKGERIGQGTRERPRFRTGKQRHDGQTRCRSAQGSGINSVLQQPQFQRSFARKPPATQGPRYDHATSGTVTRQNQRKTVTGAQLLSMEAGRPRPAFPPSDATLRLPFSSPPAYNPPFPRLRP